MPTVRVPANIRQIAQRAIDQNLSLPVSKRAAWVKDGEKKAGMGMRTARRLVSGEVDLQQLITMRAWFARHGASEEETKKRKDKTSKASIAWKLWGGTPAISWVNGSIRKLEKQKKKD